MPPLAVIVAAALDLALGDPPNRLHPVAWIGRAIAGGRRALCRGGRAQLVVGGALVTLAVAAVAAAAGLAVATLAARLGSAGPLVEGAALSLLLSIRGLVRAARAGAGPLAAGDPEAARSPRAPTRAGRWPRWRARSGSRSASAAPTGLARAGRPRPATSRARCACSPGRRGSPSARSFSSIRLRFFFVAVAERWVSSNAIAAEEGGGLARNDGHRSADGRGAHGAGGGGAARGRGLRVGSAAPGRARRLRDERRDDAGARREAPAAAVGDSLARLLRSQGARVTTEFYVNDAGTQFEALARSFEARVRQEFGETAALPENGYPGEYLIDLAKEYRAGGGALDVPGDERARLEHFGRWAVERMVEQQRRTLAAYGVDFDVWSSEQRDVRDRGLPEKAVQELAARGLTYEQDGALWFRSTAVEGAGDDQDRVLRRRTGELTYFAVDIAFHHYVKFAGVDHVIDLLGPDHHGHVPRMRAAMQALGHPPQAFQAPIIQLVTLLRDGQPVRMSKRRGEFVLLAGVFHPYYKNHRVIQDDRTLMLARLALCTAVGQVIANGLALLGVSAPETM